MSKTSELFEHAEHELYAEWKRCGPHVKEYASEFAGSLFLLFCVVGLVALMFGDSSPLPRLLPSHVLRLLLVGLSLGGASWLVAASPPGRLSGAHINPAVSVGFWLLGKMHARDLAGYVAAQMAGGLAGTALGALAFGRLAGEVKDAALNPGPQVGAWAALAAEVGTTFALTALIYAFVSHKSLVRWTPFAAMLMVGLLVAVDGAYSGAGMNPCRWFGPAAVQPFWRLWAVYALGPIVGAMFAAGLRRAASTYHAKPHTGKLLHDPRYRSIFKHDTLPTTPPRREEW